MAKDISDQIAARRKKAADLRRQADLLEAEARGMELVLQANPVCLASPQIGFPTLSSAAPAPAPAAPALPVAADASAGFLLALEHRVDGFRKGRQKGAISHRWRKILVDMNKAAPDGFTEQDLCVMATKHGVPNIRPKDARDRMLSYVNSNYVTVASGGRFKVTDHALQKFVADVFE